jgi:hypothetical protein
MRRTKKKQLKEICEIILRRETFIVKEGYSDKK